ncbi:MAG: TIGR03557 family F420-dependent LLM class oxidoreductase [Actinomycetota bacterium]
MSLEAGFHLSSEQHGPSALVEQARASEDAGFSLATISDHFHPWIRRQGHSPFVWGVLGAISQATERMQVGTAVTCPIMRIHPAVVAQAAATAAAQFGDRFFLGLGSGEYLNEHIGGDAWPEGKQRLAMLEEAVEVLHLLWKGDQVSHRGRFFTVRAAQLFTLPATPPPIMIAASGKRSSAMAAQLDDGIICESLKPEVVETFVRGGGAERPRFGMVSVCYAADEETARETARRFWPVGALDPKLLTDLETPAHFERAADLISATDLEEGTVLGPDPERYHQAVKAYSRAGFTHVVFQQFGPDALGFIEFAKKELLPEIARLEVRTS